MSNDYIQARWRRRQYRPGSKSVELSPSLELDFTKGVLDPRITFTRASAGTYYRGRFNQNAILWSETLASPWTYENTTVASSSVQNPFGTGTAYGMSETSATGLHRLQQISTTTPSRPVTVSAYVKAGIREIVSFRNANVTNAGAYFNLLTGEVYQIGAAVTAYGSQNMGNGWWRIWMTAPGAANGSNRMMFWALLPAVYPNIISSYQGDPSAPAMYIWGAQMTEAPGLTDYIPTTSAAITQGQIASAAVDVPRFEVDPVTNDSKGLLVEGSTTNLCIRSEEFDTWTALAATVTANAVVSPGGSITADKIIPDATSGAHGVYRAVTVAASTTYTQSVYLKAAEFTWAYMTEGNGVTAAAWFDLASGTVGTVSGTGTPSASITNVGNGWYRCAMTFTTVAGQTSANIQIRPTTGDNVFTAYVGNGTNGLYAWGAQVEQQGFASSYISTGTATSTRSADSASITGTNFGNWFNQSEGTMYVHTSAPLPGAGGGRVLQVDNAAQTERHQIVWTRATAASTTVSAIGATTDNSATVAILTQSVQNMVGIRHAYTYRVNDFAYSANGLAALTDSLGTLPTVDRMGIGSTSVASIHSNLCVKAVKYWPSRLSDDLLKAITTIVVTAITIPVGVMSYDGGGAEVASFEESFDNGNAALASYDIVLDGGSAQD